MVLQSGQSELDTVTLSLPTLGKEIKNWQTYQTSSKFLDPTDHFSFRISAEDATLYQTLLTPGTQVQLKINGTIQCTGFIDDRDIEYSRKGTLITITGRDILGRFCQANADPTIRLKTDMTVFDLVSQAILPYKIGTLYNSQGTNLNIITGRPNKESLSVKVTQQAYGPIYQQNADGTLLRGSDGKAVPNNNRPTKPVTEVTANIKPGLSKIKIKNLKPHPNEGAYAYVERCIRREGLILKAAADGSGVMVVSPDFTGPVDYNITCKTTTPNANNVETGKSKYSWETQPSMIVARGFGGGHEFTHGSLYCVMINELVGLDQSGNPLPEVKQVMANYKHAQLLPIRPELIPKQQAWSTDHAFCPIYIVDDEAKDQAQLAAFCQRKMAEHQMKGLTVEYTLTGHTYKGKPWAVNTLVNVDDDINNIHETMWVFERVFTKSRDGGTSTRLVLIRPFTLIIGEDKGS